MSKGSAPDAPTPPDYEKLIKAQGGQNSLAAMQQAELNRIDRVTPWGSTFWTPGEIMPGTSKRGPWVQETSFSPELQNAFDRQVNIANTGISSPGSYENYQDMAMAMARRQLDPVFDRQTEQFQQTMANRGLPMGSEAYSAGYKDLVDAQNRAYQDAAFNALDFGRGMRSQDFNENLQGRSLDYNMLASLLGQVQGTPFTPVNVQPADVMGPASMEFNANQNKYMMDYQNKMNNQSNFWNGVTGLGSAWLLSALI